MQEHCRVRYIQADATAMCANRIPISTIRSGRTTRHETAEKPAVFLLNSPSLTNHHHQRPPDDLHVRPKADIFDVLQVKLNPFLKIRTSPARPIDLPEASNPRSHA